MEIVNNITDLGLKVLWFKRVLIYLKRLWMSRAKELIIKFKFNEKERWLDLKFKNLLCFLLSYYVLGSVFDNIIIIALNNRMLNDSKFDAEVAS